MPIYEYVCGKCGEEFEALVFGKDKPACPKCDGRRLRRKMSTFAHKGSDGKMVGAKGGGCSGCSSGNCSSCH